MRYTGASVGYQLASVFGGGFAPLIAVALLAAGGDEPTLSRSTWRCMARHHGGRDLLRARDVPVRTSARPTPRAEPTERFVRKPAEDRERETAGVA